LPPLRKVGKVLLKGNDGRRKQLGVGGNATGSAEARAGGGAAQGRSRRPELLVDFDAQLASGQVCASQEKQRDK
jgi:hypothetical protein